MIPNREIYELARALMRTDEFNNMMRYKNSINKNTNINRQVMAFEEERNRIINSGLSPMEKSNRLNSLFNENKEFLDKEEIKNLTEATDKYQKMFAECIKMLHKTMDSNMNRR